MTATRDVFAPQSDEQVLRLVSSNPLAWVVSPGDDGFRATPLPLRPRVGGTGRIEALEGHMARSNPHCAALQRDPRAILLFSGPQGYISPSWVSDRTWAPTWNYAVVQFLVTIAFDETPARLDAHLHDLVGAMERGRPKAWQPVGDGRALREAEAHDRPVRGDGRRAAREVQAGPGRAGHGVRRDH